MPTKTKIEWADYISNPLKAAYVAEGKRRSGHACVKYSEGCAHCWASTFNVRLGTGLPYALQNLEKVELFLDEQELERLGKFKPRGPFKNGRERALVFPCDMTDIFGSWVSQEWRDQIFNVVGQRSDLDFLFLTKRPVQMHEYLSAWVSMPNVILGVSIENQQRALERWEAMQALAKAGWQTAISYEPALGEVDWEAWDFIKLLICGGESGQQARVMAPKRARTARDFCREHGIRYFFKQWGEFAPVADLLARGMTTFKSRPVEVEGEMMVRIGRGLAGHVLDGVEWRQMP
jgi:protein gp37